MLPLLLSGAGLEPLLEAGCVGSSHNTKGHKDKGRVGASGAWRAQDGEEESHQQSTESSSPETLLCCFFLCFKPKENLWG